MKMLKLEYMSSSSSDRHMNDCMIVATTKYKTNYTELAEGLQCQISQLTPELPSDGLFS